MAIIAFLLGGLVSYQDGLSQFVIDRVIKRFGFWLQGLAFCYHNFWLQGCAVADDIFVTLSMVLDEVIYETSLIVQSRLNSTW